MKTCLVMSVNKLRHFSLKGGFDGPAHVQATTLIMVMWTTMFGKKG